MVLDKKVKGIIYYTNNARLDPPIIPMAQRYILKSGLPIVSVSLKPINFGKNIVLVGKKSGVYTWCLQIITALENSTADQIFFCEHDFLYHKSHFDFNTERNDTYYYNTNVWRWRYHSEKVVTSDNMKSLSGLCCNRKLALEFFNFYKGVLNIRHIDTKSNKQPRFVRKMGFEPGNIDKKFGFPKRQVATWKSDFPNVDIRHRFCFTNRLTELDQMIQKPKGWTESNIDHVQDWNLRELFKNYLHPQRKKDNLLRS
ncbi:MAG: hypothetical protein ACW963_02235 [Candidatus Sifarchaeia archaeon]